MTTIKQEALKKKQDPGSKVFEARQHQFLGVPRILHVELPILMVCLVAPRQVVEQLAAAGIAERM
jgi:hypothetical protein